MKKITKLKFVILTTTVGIGFAAGTLMNKQTTEVINYIPSPPIETVKEIVIEKEKEVTVDSSLIQQQLQQLWELSTVKYSYSGACNFSSQKMLNELKIPFSTKFFIFTYDGYLKAGIDLSTADVSIEGTTATITLTGPEVFDNVILEDTVSVIDQSNNVINTIKVEDVMRVLSSEKEKMKTRAINNGVLDQAKQNAELIIKVIAAELGLEAVIIYQ